MDDIEANQDVTPADLAEQILSLNLIPNADLNYWTLGDTVAPDTYVLSGTGATIVKTGSGQADTTTLGAGFYTAKVTYGSATAKFSNTPISVISAALYSRVRGKTVTVSAVVQTAVPSQCRLIIDDGIGTTASDYHTGSNLAEVLTAQRTLSGSATKLQVYVQIESAGSVYIGGMLAAFGSVEIDDWIYGTWPPPASSLQPGIIVPGPQQLYGTKSINRTSVSTGPPLEMVTTINGSEYAVAAGSASVNVTPDPVSDGTDQFMMTRTLPANFWRDNPGRVLVINAVFLPINNANAKLLSFYHDGVIVGSTHAMKTSSAAPTRATAYIWRTGANAQAIYVEYLNNAADAAVGSSCFFGTDAATETGQIVYGFKGDATAVDEITQECMFELLQ